MFPTVLLQKVQLGRDLLQELGEGDTEEGFVEQDRCVYCKDKRRAEDRAEARASIAAILGLLFLVNQTSAQAVLMLEGREVVWSNGR